MNAYTVLESEEPPSPKGKRGPGGRVANTLLKGNGHSAPLPRTPVRIRPPVKFPVSADRRSFLQHTRRCRRQRHAGS